MASTPEFNGFEGRKKAMREFIKAHHEWTNPPRTHDGWSLSSSFWSTSSYDEKRAPYRNGDFKAERVDRIGSINYSLWEVEYRGKLFFVKETKDRTSGSDTSAITEINSLSKLNGIRSKNVGPIKYYAAFSNGNTGFLVMERYDLPLASASGVPLGLIPSYLKFRLSALTKFLIMDLCPRNTFYDKDGHQLLVFDPFKVRDKYRVFRAFWRMATQYLLGPPGRD